MFVFSFLPDVSLLCFFLWRGQQQIHPLKRETIQMHRMRQRILSIAHPGRPQNPPSRRVAAQVPGVQSELQSTLQSQNASPHPYRYQAVPLFRMWQSVSAQLRSTAPQFDAQFGRHRNHHRVGIERPQQYKCHRFIIGSVQR